jgi:hypothetical protein
MKQYDYLTSLTFAGKKIEVLIQVNRPKDHEGYHYDVELRTESSITGDEFQKLKKYLEDEGYIDAAVENYSKAISFKME